MINKHSCKKSGVLCKRFCSQEIKQESIDRIQNQFSLGKKLEARITGGILVTVLFTFMICMSVSAQEHMTGVRGEAAAIAEAEAMVVTMGGLEIWSQLKSVHFVHEWFPWYRVDSYIENEVLDLTAPRSWVKMESEVYLRIRAYSPEYKYWSIENGKFSYASSEVFDNAMERAPYSIYRIARAVAIGDPFYEIRFGEGDIPRSRRLEFYGPDGELHGWIILNAKKEPLVWATNQYRYIFGPMKRFGNLRVPNWAVYENGSTMYEMISLKGSNKPPEISLFKPPAGAMDSK